MSKCLSLFLLIITFAFTSNAFSKPSGGSGSEGVQNACEISGGRFVGSEGGNWACCWSDWGCYGCVDGVCKIKCTTNRCRKANSMSHPGTGEITVKGLSPAGTKAPIVPKSGAPVLKNKSDSLQKSQ